MRMFSSFVFTYSSWSIQPSQVIHHNTFTANCRLPDNGASRKLPDGTVAADSWLTKVRCAQSSKHAAGLLPSIPYCTCVVEVKISCDELNAAVWPTDYGLQEWLLEPMADNYVT